MKIAVIADTHDLLRPSLLSELRGATMILHAGDICSSEVVGTLQKIAPLYIVRGNNDHGDWAREIPETLQLSVGELSIFMLHDRKQLGDFSDYEQGKFDLVIAGHSHRPIDEVVDGQRFINPGSCGPRRFSLPVSMAWLTKTESGFQLRHVNLVD